MPDSEEAENASMRIVLAMLIGLVENPAKSTCYLMSPR
jgi:hypothetical protein